MLHPWLLHPEPLPLQLSTADLYPAGDTQTHFLLSLCGISGSWCSQGLFEPSEHLWQEWGLILNMNSPLLLSYWAFCFAFGYGVSPHSSTLRVSYANAVGALGERAEQ